MTAFCNTVKFLHRLLGVINAVVYVLIDAAFGALKPNLTQQN